MVSKEATMSIELTAEQLRAVKQGEPVKLSVPEVGEDVVLLRVSAYEGVQELLEEERVRKGIARVAVRNAARRLDQEP
jgi:hypothetical protein